jgi:hypothetical protein
MKTPGILKGGRCRDCRWRTPSAGCADPVRKSGRCGDWVWYPRGSKQCKRRWVSPRDPRTPGQLRSRAALGAASKEWSHSEKLTEEQREDWRRKAGKVQSRVRLGQSGPLTGQLNYVGRKTEKAEPISQVPQSEKAAQSMWEQYDHSTIAPVWQRRRGGERGGKAEARRAASQVPPYQRVARSTWEQHRGTTLGPRWEPSRMSRVSWTLRQCCEGLHGRIGRAGSRRLREGRIGRSARGLAGCRGSGGKERLARE